MTHPNKNSIIMSHDTSEHGLSSLGHWNSSLYRWKYLLYECCWSLSLYSSYILKLIGFHRQATSASSDNTSMCEPMTCNSRYLHEARWHKSLIIPCLSSPNSMASGKVGMYSSSGWSSGLCSACGKRGCSYPMRLDSPRWNFLHWPGIQCNTRWCRSCRSHSSTPARSSPIGQLRSIPWWWCACQFPYGLNVDDYNCSSPSTII